MDILEDLAKDTAEMKEEFNPDGLAMNTLFEIGDRVRMKAEVLNELDREGIWHWHEGLRGKVLTITAIDIGPAGWVDYYIMESPFVLAEKWLEKVEEENDYHSKL